MRKLARASSAHERFQDLDLRIEFRKGGKRPYRDDAGHEKFKTMAADYGEIVGTEGLDGDPVDVYVGPKVSSNRVFVITQMTKGDWKTVDEEKCVLGVESAAAAKALYLKHYDDTRFFGGVKEMSMQQFKKKLATKGAVGAKIAHNAARIAELNYMLLEEGAPILIDHDAAKVAGYQPVLGEDPEAEEVPGITDFGKAQPEQKVARFLDRAKAAEKAIDWGKRLAAMNQRKDPAHLHTARPTHNTAIATADRKRSEVHETEVTEIEQRGLGVRESQVRKDLDPPLLRKAAELARVSLFVKQAAMSPAKRENTQGKALSGLGGAILGATGGMHVAGKKLRGNPAGAYLTIMGGALGGSALAQSAHHHATHTNNKLDTAADKERKGRRAGAAALGAAAGAGLGHLGLKLDRKRLTQAANKLRAIKHIDDSIGEKMTGHNVRKAIGLPSREPPEVEGLRKARDMVKNTKREHFSDQGKLLGSQRAAAYGGGAAIGAGAGYGISRAGGGDNTKKADAERAGRMAGAVDDVGIAALASPYIADGVAKRLAGKAGTLGRIGQGAANFAEKFRGKSRYEIGSLALVGHTGSKLVGKGIDKGLDAAGRPSQQKVAATPMVSAPAQIGGGAGAGSTFRPPAALNGQPLAPRRAGTTTQQMGMPAAPAPAQPAPAQTGVQPVAAQPVAAQPVAATPAPVPGVVQHTPAAPMQSVPVQPAPAPAPAPAPVARPAPHPGELVSPIQHVSAAQATAQPGAAALPAPAPRVPPKAPAQMPVATNNLAKLTENQNPAVRGSVGRAAQRAIDADLAAEAAAVTSKVNPALKGGMGAAARRAAEADLAGQGAHVAPRGLQVAKTAPVPVPSKQTMQTGTQASKALVAGEGTVAKEVAKHPGWLKALGAGAKGVLRGGLGLGVGALGVGALGLGAGAHIMGRALRHEPHSVAPLQYAAPRIY